MLDAGRDRALGASRKGRRGRRLVLWVAAGTLVLALKGVGLPARPGRAELDRELAAVSESAGGSVQGTIGFVNRLTRAVRVGAPDRVAGRDLILQVTDDTRIHARGRRASFSDLREGDHITASYEIRTGINTATSIETQARLR
jgi:hypothetical protein